MLRRHFNVATVPVIALEILADLKRSAEEQSNQDLVRSLAAKLLPSQSLVMVPYQVLLEGSLLGHRVTMDYRPIVQGRDVEDPDGTTGFVREPTDEERAIERWGVGDFTAAEEALAARWRETFEKTDLESIQRGLAKTMKQGPEVQDMEAVCGFVGKLQQSPAQVVEMIRLSMAVSRLESTVVNRVWFRWMSTGKRPLAEFSPYALYFSRVVMTFFAALGARLIGTRRTNVIDLEYLYYLPFCEVFCSRDAFHATMVPTLIDQSRQLYVNGDDLKGDLQALTRRWAGLSTADQDEELSRFGGQPVVPDSLVASIWRHCWPKWRLKEREAVELSDERRQELLERIQRLQNAPDRQGELTEEQSDFMMISREMSYDEPCFCNSGRAFGECHGRELQNSD